MISITDFTGRPGLHCETTATGSLLYHIGIELSEPMLFGLGEGLSYIFWNMKMMDCPFIGGRNKPDMITANICKNLDLELIVRETSSLKKAWQNVAEFLDNDVPVGLKLDSYYLDYFTEKFHFAGHYVCIYGYDDEYGYLIDTAQQGGMVKATLENIALARNAKGPMSSRNRSYTIAKKKDVIDLRGALRKAISANATEYLNPPIKNISYKGIEKTATEIKKWFRRSKDVKRDFKTTAMLMEKAGTGGSLFRNIYRDFLKESSELLESKEIEESSDRFAEIAGLWKEVAVLFDRAGDTENIAHIEEASEILNELSVREKSAMELLME